MAHRSAVDDSLASLGFNFQHHKIIKPKFASTMPSTDRTIAFHNRNLGVISTNGHIAFKDHIESPSPSRNDLMDNLQRPLP